MEKNSKSFVFWTLAAIQYDSKQKLWQKPLHVVGFCVRTYSPTKMTCGSVCASSILLSFWYKHRLFSSNFINMGKKKSQSNDETHNKSDDTIESSSSKVKKSSKPQPITEKLSAIIKSVRLPENTEGLTAEKLTENQKHALKKVCAKMYGHQHTEKKQLPAKSLESATAQLAEKMKEKLAQRKREKAQAKAKLK